MSGNNANHEYGPRSSSLQNAGQWTQQNPSKTENFKGTPSGIGGKTFSIGNTNQKEVSKNDVYWEKKKPNGIVTSSRQSALELNMSMVADVKGKPNNDGDRKDLRIYKPEGQKEKYPHISTGRKVSKDASAPPFSQAHITTKDKNGKEIHIAFSGSSVTRKMEENSVKGTEFRNVKNTFKENHEGKQEQTKNWLNNSKNTGNKAWEENYQKKYHAGSGNVGSYGRYN